MPTGILARILEAKRAEVAAAKAAAVSRRAAPFRPVRDFAAALRRPAGAPPRVIAEFKRASPSAGPIRAGADPAAIAREYQAAGAAALSVLTDRDFFDGGLEHLEAARAAVSLPVLRKDFTIDAFQVDEARRVGADAILLIVAALDDATLRALYDEARRLGLAVLVEVHDEAEGERALAAGAEIVGVNHRNLATFEMDMTLFARLKPRFPAHVVGVAESGIKTADDVRRLADAGADAILVGESLMRRPSPGDALRELLCP